MGEKIQELTNTLNNSNLLELRSKLPQYKQLKLKPKYSLAQLLASLVIGLFLLCCFVCIVTQFLLETPLLILTSTQLISDPSQTLDLSSLPRLKYHFLANIRITHSNIIPMPVHLTYTASFDDENPSYRVNHGEVYNQVLLPRTALYTTITANLDIDLLETRSRSLYRVMDSCGMFGGGRTPVFVTIYGKISFGYSFIAIPVREAIYYNLEFPCPMPDENLGQIVLGVLNKMIPYEEQYNNTENNEILKRHLGYIAY